MTCDTWAIHVIFEDDIMTSLVFTKTVNFGSSPLVLWEIHGIVTTFFILFFYRYSYTLIYCRLRIIILDNRILTVAEE